MTRKGGIDEDLRAARAAPLRRRRSAPSVTGRRCSQQALRHDDRIPWFYDVSRLGVELQPPITSQLIDDFFQTTGRRRKGEFALELGAELSRRLDAAEAVTVPGAFSEMFNFLSAYDEDRNASAPATDN